MKKSKIKYCSFCGEKMLKLKVGAEEYIMCYIHGCCGPVHKRYNTETGERQYIYKYICSNYKKKLLGYSDHDKSYDKKIIT